MKMRHRPRQSFEKWHERWRPRFTGRPGPTVTGLPLEIKAVGEFFSSDPRSLSEWREGSSPSVGSARKKREPEMVV